MSSLTFNVLTIALLIVSVSAFAGGAAFADEHDDDDSPRKIEDTPRLTVRGDIELKKPADELQMKIGVVTEHSEASRALDENNKLMVQVVDAIKLAGLDENEYETGRFRVRPNYSRRPRQAGPEWKPQIVGYEVVNDVIIKTRQLDLAGVLIEQANKAGANTIEVIGFTLAKPRMYRAEAIAGATKNAMEDARALADAASLDLVRVISINLDQMSTPVREMAMRGMAMAADASGGAAPITPGDVSVRASVTMVFEIAPAH